VKTVATTGAPSPGGSQGSAAAASGGVGHQTLAGLFWGRVDASAHVDAEMVKRDGTWHRLTWADVGTIVREAALGLLALGLRPCDGVAILSGTRAEWVQADFAVLSAAGVSVPVYPSYTAEQIGYVLADSDARFLIVEDEGLAARALGTAAAARLEHIVLLEGQAGSEPRVMRWADLRALGRARREALAPVLAERVASLRPDDIATIVYTSGTTGEPKGVAQTHANHVAMLGALARIPGVERGDVHLVFLPLAHSFARMEVFLGVHRELLTAFAESVDKLPDNLREVRPHFIFGVPRLYEKVHARMLARAEAAPRLLRRVFSRALALGAEVAARRRAGRQIPFWLTLRHRAADALVLSRLRAAFGGRLRFAVSGGAPLAPEIAEFFHGIGLLIVEGYGLTEASPALTFNRIDRFKFGSVGQALPDVELRIEPDGEILARGPNIALRGYWKRPEATAGTFTPDGWLRTGDIGRIDEEGFLYITDRKKELIVTSRGLNIAPQPIEDRLRADPLVSQAVVYGDRRPYATALVTLEAEQVRRFARDRGILVTDPVELARRPEIVERVRGIVEETNRSLPSYAAIRNFAVVPGDFTEEAGELTPTQKVKRKVVAAHYADLLDSLYR
jgi:long-chain acyl-CoA synthetase